MVIAIHCYWVVISVENKGRKVSSTQVSGWESISMLLSVSLDFRLERAVGFIFTYHIYYIMINFMVSFKSNSDAFSPNVHWSVLEIEIPSIGGKGFCLPNVGFSLLVFFSEEERALQASSHLNLKASGLHHHCSGYWLPGSSKEDVTLCSFHILLYFFKRLEVVLQWTAGASAISVWQV